MKARQIIDRITDSNLPEAVRFLESGLSRVSVHIENHDCAILTAFKARMIFCARPVSGKEVPSLEDNIGRNRELKAVLLKKQYGVTEVDGSYIEGYGTEIAKEVAENSFFVINLNDNADFISTISGLGEYYCQDSVLIKPKGESAYLLGTNFAVYPGFNQKDPKPTVHFGRESEFMTRVKNRPFYFETIWDYGNGSKSCISGIAKRVLENLESLKSNL